MKTPSYTPVPTSSWPLLLEAHALLVRAVEARLKEGGLPPLEWYDVLWALERATDQRLRMHALAEQLLLTRFNVTRLVDRLEKAGLVARQKMREDRRGAYAVLTEKGRAVRRRMWPVYRAGIVDLFDRHLSAGEHSSLQRMLRMVLAENRRAVSANVEHRTVRRRAASP